MIKIEEVLTRRVDEVLPSRNGLEKLLRSGRKLNIYQGFDPTGSHLHLGHTVGMHILQNLADLGHNVSILFGTGTVLAGDPSQRESARKKITIDEIKKNISTWKKQLEPILDFEKIRIVHNDEWLLGLSLKEIIEIASNISAVQLIKRDMFQRRLKKGDTIWTHEMLYPLLQGYDSVKMDVDLEIGGTDQKFNMLVGRELVQKMKGKEKFVITVTMITGTDGKQMSKSAGNGVWLDDPAEVKFGKIMSCLDEQIIPYMKLVTNIPLEKVDNYEKDLKSGKINHINAKKRLAWEIVKMYHSESLANDTQSDFEKTFQQKSAEYKKAVAFKNMLVKIVENVVGSKSEAKRVIKSGGVDVDGKAITDPKFSIKGGERIKIGKRIFVRVSSKK